MLVLKFSMGYFLLQRMKSKCLSEIGICGDKHNVGTKGTKIRNLGLRITGMTHGCKVKHVCI